MQAESVSTPITDNSKTADALPTAWAAADAGSLERIDALMEYADDLVRSALRPDTVALTIVIPVYNEPETILEIVDRVRKLKIEKQIVVVNDGSTDNTAEQLKKLDGLDDVEVLHHPENRGKGAALQTGFKQARGEIVIVQDADLEYDPRDIIRVIKPLQEGTTSVAYGSRYLLEPKQDPSRVHRFGNWALTWLSNRLTGYRLTDMETCYKAFDRRVLDQLTIEQPRFGFEPEITAKIAKLGLEVKEVGVSYQCRSRSEGKKIGWRDMVSAIYCILRYNLFR